MSDLHPDLEPLAFLLGTWSGEGDGEYPTTESFRYGEELTFEHAGEPCLMYSQRSWSLEDGSPLHFERGFVRPLGDGKVDLVLAYPVGVVEVEGTVTGTSIELASTGIRRSAAGDPVTALARRYEAHGDELAYELDMATETVPITHHVSSRLRRV